MDGQHRMTIRLNTFRTRRGVNHAYRRLIAGGGGGYIDFVYGIAATPV